MCLYSVWYVMKHCISNWRGHTICTWGSLYRCCTNPACRSWGLDIAHQGSAPGCVDGKPCCWLDKCAGLEQPLLKNCSWGCVSGRSGRADDPTQCKACTSTSCAVCAAGPPPPPSPSPPTTGSFTVDLGGEGAYFHHHWEECVGSGHASLTLRADWRAHLTRTRRDLGVKRTRFHGLLDDDFSISLSRDTDSYINLDALVDFHGRSEAPLSNQESARGH